MPLTIWLFAILSIACTAVAQLIMKMGMTKIRLAAPSGPDFVLMILKSPLVMGGLGMYGFAAMLWLIVLSRAPLSTAYPLISLGFVIVAFLSWSVLGEAMPITRIGGIALIIAGVVLVGVR